MLKKIIYVLCAIIVLQLLQFIGASYTFLYVQPHILGTSVPIGVATELYDDEFSWKGVTSENYKIISASFSGNNSKCKTVFCHFISNDNKTMLVLGKVDEILFGSDSVCFDETHFSSMFYTYGEKSVDRIDITYFLYQPHTIFNTRFIPKGKALRIYGMNLDTTYTITNVDRKIRVCEGMFERLAFEVVPGGILIKNYVKELRFNSLQYGVLFFIKTSDNKSAFVLLHCNYDDASLIKEMKESFVQDVSRLQILDTKY